MIPKHLQFHLKIKYLISNIHKHQHIIPKQNILMYNIYVNSYCNVFL